MSSWSCEAISVVTPTRLKSRNTFMMRCALSWSRLAVGSSAIRIAGRLTMARAIARRCCSPPESSMGLRSSLPDSPTLSRAARARDAAESQGCPWTASGSITFSNALRSNSRCVSCRMTPTARRRYGRARAGSLSSRCPFTWIDPRLAGSRPPISLSRVDLPAPDGPDTKTNSPALTRKLMSARILRPRPYDLNTCWNSIMAAVR